MIAQLTKNERQLALIILLVMSVCGFAMAVAGLVIPWAFTVPS